MTKETTIDIIEKNSVHFDYIRVYDFHDSIYGKDYDFSYLTKKGEIDRKTEKDISKDIIITLHKEMEKAYKEVENVVMNNGEFSTNYQKSSNSTEIGDIHPDLDPKKEAFMVYAFKQMNSFNVEKADSKAREAISKENEPRYNDIEEMFNQQKKQETTYIDEVNQYASSLIESLSKTEMPVDQEQSILKDFITKSSSQFESNPYDKIAFSIKQNVTNGVTKNLKWNGDQIDQFIDDIMHTKLLNQKERKNNDSSDIVGNIRRRKLNNQQQANKTKEPNSP